MHNFHLYCICEKENIFFSNLSIMTTNIDKKPDFMSKLNTLQRSRIFRFNLKSGWTRELIGQNYI
jgi:hypothetical protein